MQRFEFNNGKVIVDGVELKYVQSVAMLVNVDEQPSIIIKMFADPDKVVIDCDDGCIEQHVFDVNTTRNGECDTCKPYNDLSIVPRNFLTRVFRKLMS